MAEAPKTHHTPRERVVLAYKGGFADRVPAYPIAGSFAGCLDGLSIEEYCTNPTKATKAMLNYYERYEPDIMIAFNDLAKEAEAIGCHVKYSDYVVPSIDRHVLQDDKDIVGRSRRKKVGSTVHSCGTTHQSHEDLVDVAFVAITIDLDQQSDPALKVDQLDRLVTLGNQRGVVAIGNVDVTIFERATRAEIEAEVRRCIDTVGHRSRFVLSTSCELPPRANPDCVKWFMEAAREYGRWDRSLAR